MVARAPTHAQLSVPTAATQRRTELAQIHMLATGLQMDTTDRNPGCEYRQLLLQHGGHASAADMSAQQRAKVIAHLKAITKARGLAQGRTMTQPQFAQHLWAQLGQAGALKDPSPAGLDAFVHSTVGVRSVRFMGPAQGNKVIEALKAWVARSKASKASKAGHEAKAGTP